MNTDQAWFDANGRTVSGLVSVSPGGIRVERCPPRFSDLSADDQTRLRTECMAQVRREILPDTRVFCDVVPERPEFAMSDVSLTPDQQAAMAGVLAQLGCATEPVADVPAVVEAKPIKFREFL